jgi:Flp pilus assembly pilin Flp
MGFIKNLTAKIHASGVAARAKGQALVEYGLILVLVSVVAVVGLTALSGQLYTSTAPAITGTVGSASATIPGTSPVFNKVIFALSGHNQSA